MTAMWVGVVRQHPPMAVHPRENQSCTKGRITWSMRSSSASGSHAERSLRRGAVREVVLQISKNGAEGGNNPKSPPVRRASDPGSMLRVPALPRVG